ncbi:hypothetical protein ScPMuIL_015854 [Solemya velum]
MEEFLATQSTADRQSSGMPLVTTPRQSFGPSTCSSKLSHCKVILLIFHVLIFAADRVTRSESNKQHVEGDGNIVAGPGATINVEKDMQLKRLLGNTNEEMKVWKLNKNICVYDSNEVDKSSPSQKSWTISQQDLLKIVKIESCLGFPQCCQAFVSDFACFRKSVDFFKRPLKVLGDILDEMYRSSDKDVQHNYCVLGCVLIYDGFSEDNIRKIDESESDICLNVTHIAKACRLQSVLSGDIHLAAERLSTSYLVFANGKYSFRHDSMLESVFVSFFKLRTGLVINYCEWKLLERMVATKSDDKKDRYCMLHQDHYGKFITRMVGKLLKNSWGYSGTVNSLLSHRVFKSTNFVNSFFPTLSSSQRSSIIAIRHGSLLEQSGECPSVKFVEILLSELQSEWCTKEIESGLRKALYRACVVDNYDVYEYLTTKHSLIPDAHCLHESCSQCSIKVLSDMLGRYQHWSPKFHIQEALIGTCRSIELSSVDVYKCLMEYVDEQKIKGIAGVNLLQYAIEGGSATGKVSDLLQRYKDSFRVSHIQEALIGACRSKYKSSVDVYKCLMEYVDEQEMKGIAGVDLLQYAVEGAESEKVSDLLQRYKDSFRVSHIQEALIGACRSDKLSSVDVYKCLMEYVDEQKIKGIAGVDLLQYAIEGAESKIVSDLLQRYKDSFRVSHIQEALIGACRSDKLSSVDVYKCLMEYVDEQEMKGIAGVDLLQYAVEGAESEKVSDLLQRYKDSFRVSHIQEALIGACRSKYKSSVDVYKCLMEYVDEQEMKGIAGVDLLQYAVEGAESEKVSDLLQRYKDSFRVSHIQEALIGACRSKYKSSVDVYKCLMEYVDEQEMKGIAGVDLLQYAVEGGSAKGKVSDLLQRYKDSFRVSHIQKALIGACQSIILSSVDVYKCLMEYVDEQEMKGIAGVDLLQYAVEGGSAKGKVSDLLQRYKDSFRVSHIQEALIGACRSEYKSSVDVYKCLMEYVDEQEMKGIAGVDLLQYAVQGGSANGKVSDLLQRYKDSFRVSHIQEALIGACRSEYKSSVDVYKCLMEYVDEQEMKGIAGVDLLQYVVQGGSANGKVSDLLQRYKDSFRVSHIQEALIGACRSEYKSSVDVYKCLMEYVDEQEMKGIAGVDLLQYAVQGGSANGKVSDLLQRYKDSFRVSHIQEALIGACRSMTLSSVDAYKCLMEFVDEQEIKGIAGVDLLQYAIEGAESEIVSDLLQRYKD